MNRIAASMGVLGLSLAMVASGCTARVNPKQEKATAGEIHGKPRQLPKSKDSAAKSPLMKRAETSR